MSGADFRATCLGNPARHPQVLQHFFSHITNNPEHFAAHIQNGFGQDQIQILGLDPLMYYSIAEYWTSWLNPPPTAVTSRLLLLLNSGFNINIVVAATGYPEQPNPAIDNSLQYCGILTLHTTPPFRLTTVHCCAWIGPSYSESSSFTPRACHQSPIHVQRGCSCNGYGCPKAMATRTMNCARQRPYQIDWWYVVDKICGEGFRSGCSGNDRLVCQPRFRHVVPVLRPALIVTWVMLAPGGTSVKPMFSSAGPGWYSAWHIVGYFQPFVYGVFVPLTTTVHVRCSTNMSIPLRFIRPLLNRSCESNIAPELIVAVLPMHDCGCRCNLRGRQQHCDN